MLEIRNISYRIGKKDILSEISFSAMPGTFTGILGPNGAGKSTLLKLVAGEFTLQNGNILLKQRSLSDFSIRELSLQRAVMTQSIHMSSHFKVHEVVMMGRYPHFNSVPHQKDILAARKSLAMVDLADMEHRLYVSLSGGEQQRVQFARVLAQMTSENASGPKMLLLDEPLNNLDVKHQHLLMETARQFAQAGNIVIAVLHDINLAAYYTDELVLLSKGKKIAMGKPADVITSEILESCYQFPVTIGRHPFHGSPVVYFGSPVSKNKHDNQQQFLYDTQVKF